MPTPPPADVIEPHDTSIDEVETRAEFDRRLAEGSLAGLTVQGLRLDLDPVPDLRAVEVAGTLFVGCRFADREVGADLVRRGANVVPPFSGLPYPTQPAHLYTPDDLAAGFAEGGFAGMYDTRVYAHFRAHGGALPDVREALGQRLHDHGVDNALADATRAWLAVHGPQSVVGVMGGHAVHRGSAAYRMAAVLGWELARAGGPVGAALAALAARDGATTLEFGHWHGDWVPWNLGTHRGRLFAWDWENSGRDRPVGFDLAHQAFQSALSLRGRPVPEATVELVDVLDRHGEALGLDPARRRLVADAYLVELWLRTAELAAGGGGWSGRLHPALLHVLADRSGSPRE
ncbi:hypothetical protein [Micromonospora sp. NPDC003776]